MPSLVMATVTARLVFASLLLGTATLIAGAIVPDLLPIDPEKRRHVVRGLLVIVLALYVFAGYLYGVEHGWWVALRRRIRLPRLRRAGNLYIGRILVSDSRLDAENYLDLTIRLHNGRPSILRYIGASGFARVEFSRDGNGVAGFDLPPPIFMFENGACGAGDELVLSFRLVLTPAQVAEFREREAANEVPQIMFSRLDIMVASGRRTPERLPLWDGVNFRHGMVSGQIVCVTASSTARAGATLG